MANFKHHISYKCKSEEEQKERILCSAIYFNDGEKYSHQPVNIDIGFTIEGRRHSDCFMTMFILTKGNRFFLGKEETQGFITTKNRFVDRHEAWKIAKEANQIIENPNRYWDGRLFSEDLY